MKRSTVVSTLVPVYLTLITGLPLLVGAGIVAVAPTPAWRAIAWMAAFPVYIVAYVLVAGGLSRLTLGAIVPGRYPRDLGHPVYGPRRLYAVCWTAIYYFPPLYHVVLAVPVLKRLTFRLFGYQGAVDATFYPDGWIRDLPLLDIGRGAYIANRATLGSNICLQDGQIVVSPIRIGARAVIGHAAIIGLGNNIGDNAEVGVRSTLGLGVRVGAGTRVGAIVGINHGAVIGEGCEIESMCYVGKKAVIHDGVRIRAGSVVPDEAVIRTQDDADLCAPPQCSLVSGSSGLRTRRSISESCLTRVGLGSHVAPFSHGPLVAAETSGVHAAADRAE